MATSLATSSLSEDARWKFIQAEDTLWRWSRAESSEGPATSPPFVSFGRCLSDAIKHGFRPDLHPYSKRTGIASPSGSLIEWIHATRLPPVR